MICQFVTSRGTMHYDRVSRAVVPATGGTMELLPGHAECFALLEAGKVHLTDPAGKISAVAIPPSGLYIKNDLLMIVS